MLRLKYPRGIEWQVNGPETHKLYDASSYTIHLNLHQRVRRKINGGGTGLGRVLWECGEAVRPGRAGKWVQRPPSWRLILQYCSGPEMVVRDFGTTGGARPILILPPHTWPREVKTSTNCGGVWDHTRAWRPPRPCPHPPPRPQFALCGPDRTKGVGRGWDSKIKMGGRRPSLWFKRVYPNAVKRAFKFLSRSTQQGFGTCPGTNRPQEILEEAPGLGPSRYELIVKPADQHQSYFVRCVEPPVIALGWVALKFHSPHEFIWWRQPWPRTLLGT